MTFFFRRRRLPRPHLGNVPWIRVTWPWIWWRMRRRIRQILDTFCTQCRHLVVSMQDWIAARGPAHVIRQYQSSPPQADLNNMSRLQSLMQRQSMQELRYGNWFCTFSHFYDINIEVNFSCEGTSCMCIILILSSPTNPVHVDMRDRLTPLQ